MRLYQRPMFLAIPRDNIQSGIPSNLRGARRRASAAASRDHRSYFFLLLLQIETCLCLKLLRWVSEWVTMSDPWREKTNQKETTTINTTTASSNMSDKCLDCQSGVARMQPSERENHTHEGSDSSSNYISVIIHILCCALLLLLLFEVFSNEKYRSDGKDAARITNV